MNPLTKTLKEYTQPLKGIILGLLLVLGMSYAMAAWNGPTATPPNANTDAPINVGANGQSKSGNLIVGTGVTSGLGFGVTGGNVGIGTVSPSTKLDVTGGDITITTATKKLIFDNIGRYIQGTRSGADYLTIANNAFAPGIQVGFDAGAGFGPTMTLTPVSSSNNPGNVGIGNTAPTEKLDVTGNIKASGTVCDSNGCIGSSGGGEGVVVGGGSIYSDPDFGSSCGAWGSATCSGLSLSCPLNYTLTSIGITAARSDMGPSTSYYLCVPS